MGVRGLQTFIEEHCPPECFSKVSIKQLVEDFRAQTGESNPKIVFDGPSTMRFIYGDLDWVSGGQITEFLARVKDFVNAFKDIGVHPVFFFGGYADITSRKGWFLRCREKMKRVHTIVDRLADGTKTADLDSFLYLMPTNIGYAHYFQQIEGCEVRKGLADCDAEIAHYARENNCLAVFGQDSEFLVYKSVKYYLSAKHFDLAKMETRNYSREHLIKSLGIQSSQLPLFATLAGNNVVNYFKDLRYFHSFLCKKGKIRFEELYPAIAEYIRLLPCGSALFDVLPDVAKDALQNADASTLIAASIRSYLLTPKSLIPVGVEDYPEWKATMERAEELHRTNLNSSIVFKIMLGEGFASSTGMEDFRKRDLPPAMRLLRTLRRRFYGIILKEKPIDLEPGIIEEWSVEAYKILDKPFEVLPIFPEDHHPGLIALWSDDRSEDMEITRWRLFVHGVSPQLGPEDLLELPDHLIIPVATLFYFVEGNFLEPWEIEALLAVAVTLPSESLERLADLPSDPVDLRALRIATIYLRGITAVIRLLSVCGYPLSSSKAFSYAYFDGKLFQLMYKNAKFGVSQDVLLEDQTHHVPQFQKARQILFKNLDHRHRPFRKAPY